MGTQTNWESPMVTNGVLAHILSLKRQARRIEEFSVASQNVIQRQQVMACRQLPFKMPWLSKWDKPWTAWNILLAPSFTLRIPLSQRLHRFTLQKLPLFSWNRLFISFEIRNYQQVGLKWSGVLVLCIKKITCRIYVLCKTAEIRYVLITQPNTIGNGYATGRKWVKFANSINICLLLLNAKNETPVGLNERE